MFDGEGVEMGSQDGLSDLEGSGDVVKLGST